MFPDDFAGLRTAPRWSGDSSFPWWAIRRSPLWWTSCTSSCTSTSPRSSGSTTTATGKPSTPSDICARRAPSCTPGLSWHVRCSRAELVAARQKVKEKERWMWLHARTTRNHTLCCNFFLSCIELYKTCTGNFHKKLFVSNVTYCLYCGKKTNRASERTQNFKNNNFSYRFQTYHNKSQMQCTNSNEHDKHKGTNRTKPTSESLVTLFYIFT